MMKCLAFLLLLMAEVAGAQTLTLQKYLADVKAGNPDARAAVESIASYESRNREAEIPLMPEAYGNYTLSEAERSRSFSRGKRPFR